jgi:hypothetical protein
MVSIDGRKTGELHDYLFNSYKIHATTIEWENIKGMRITPNVYTTTRNLDLLVEGIERFAKMA